MRTVQYSTAQTTAVGLLKQIDQIQQIALDVTDQMSVRHDDSNRYAMCTCVILTSGGWGRSLCVREVHSLQIGRLIDGQAALLRERGQELSAAQ